MKINAEELLRPLGFINMTDVRVMDGLVEKRRLHFPKSDNLKSKWSRSTDMTVITDSEGNVYMRYGSDDITDSPVFVRVIKEFGCVEDKTGMLIHVCVPSGDLRLNYLDIMKNAGIQLSSVT